MSDQRPSGFLPMSEIAELLGVSDAYVNKRWRKDAPTVRVAQRVYVDARVVIGNWRKEVEAKAAIAGGADPEMIADGDSVGLERWRMAKAIQEELKARALQKELFERGDVEQVFGILREALRNVGNQFKRKGWKDQLLILNRGLERAEKQFAAMIDGGVDGDS